jgi:hypothetical protein
MLNADAGHHLVTVQEDSEVAPLRGSNHLTDKLR